MHLSMVCPRMGGAGNPREFDFVRLYLGRDFDIHKGPLGGKFDLVAILESGESLGMSPPSWKIPRSHLDELPAFLFTSDGRTKGKDCLDVYKAKNCCF